MEEFNMLEKVINLFQSKGGYGSNNAIFIAYKDMRKNSGLVGGMEYPFDGLLINQNENGIGMFFLKQPGLVLTQNITKMNLDKESYLFIPKENNIYLRCDYDHFWHNIKNLAQERFELI